MASYLASTAPQVQKKCAQPACGDPATHHLKTFLHGRTRVTLSVTVVPAAQALPGAERGQIWVWARPLYGDAVPDPAVRRVPLSQDACCLSFGEGLSCQWRPQTQLSLQADMCCSDATRPVLCDLQFSWMVLT